MFTDHGLTYADEGEKDFRALCLRVADGESYEDFDSSTLLHVGLRDSKGRVTHFDERGVHRTSARKWGLTWVLVVKGVTQELQAEWDERLKLYAASERARNRRFRKRKCNCFHFVARFLAREPHEIARELMVPVLHNYQLYLAAHQILRGLGV